jgi:hypothetical protein
MLAIIALAVASATAQAAPHIYLNNARVAEGTTVPFTLGENPFKLKNSTTGEVECHASASAYLENPVGGGPAIGKLQSITFSECIDKTCSVLGGGVGIEGTNLPWQLALLIEHKAFKLVIGEAKNPIGITVRCQGGDHRNMLRTVVGINTTTTARLRSIIW